MWGLRTGLGGQGLMASKPPAPAMGLLVTAAQPGVRFSMKASFLKHLHCMANHL